MSEEFAGPNCRRQSLIYPDAMQDQSRRLSHLRHVSRYARAIPPFRSAACARGGYEPLVSLHL
jgi:hypothetical protein